MFISWLDKVLSITDIIYVIFNILIKNLFTTLTETVSLSQAVTGVLKYWSLMSGHHICSKIVFRGLFQAIVMF